MVTVTLSPYVYRYKLGLLLKVIYIVEYLVLKGWLSRFTFGERSHDLKVKEIPMLRSPKFIYHQETTAQ